MGDRKAPTLRPKNQAKPAPPPAPPFRVSVTCASCTLFFSDRAVVCPVCGVNVPKATSHTCEGGRGGDLERRDRYWPERWKCKKCGKPRRRHECLSCGNIKPLTDERRVPGASAR